MSTILAGGAGPSDHNDKSHTHETTSKGHAMKGRIVTLAGFCVLAAALALPASGAAGTTPTVQAGHYTVTFSTSWCGIDNLIETDSFSGVGWTDASGATTRGAGGGIAFTITNPTNGKGVRYTSGGTGSMTTIPNADGTYTVYFHFSGMFKYSALPGGQPLASGQGLSDAVALVDSSGNFISGQFVHSGGSGPNSNLDPCPLIVAAIT